MTVIRNIFLILILFLTVLTSFGQETAKERIAHFNVKKIIAISGYDPVSYFSNNPTKGNPKFAHKHNGIVYLFSSEKNKTSFIEKPSQYEPAYGGWCAYAMGGEKVDKVAINPTTYKIIDNRLYSFYNKFGVNTLEKWDKEGEEKLKNNADKNWKKIISK